MNSCRVHAVVGVLSAVDDVHHRHGKDVAAHAAEVLVEGQVEHVGAGLGAGEGDGEHGVGAELALVVRAVELDEELVDLALLAGIHADEFGTDDVAHVGDGLLHALAEVARRVSVAQLDGFVLARGRAGWERPPGRIRRSRAGRPPRRWGCRGNRGSPVR